jgi:uracil phosphoribosyltransferase
MAVEVLKSRGVPEDHILFLNLIASPQGVENFATKFPKLKVVTAFIDQVSISGPFAADNRLTWSQGLDEKK